MDLEFDLLRMKFPMQQLKSVWSRTVAGFEKTQMWVCFPNSVFIFPTCGFQLGSSFFTVATYSCIAWWGLVSPRAFQASLGQRARYQRATRRQHNVFLQCEQWNMAIRITYMILGGVKPSSIHVEAVNVSVKPWLLPVQHCNTKVSFKQKPSCGGHSKFYLL